jgi:hypothetical protein
MDHVTPAAQPSLIIDSYADFLRAVEGAIHPSLKMRKFAVREELGTTMRWLMPDAINWKVTAAQLGMLINHYSRLATEAPANRAQAMGYCDALLKVAEPYRGKEDPDLEAAYAAARALQAIHYKKPTTVTLDDETLRKKLNVFLRNNPSFNREAASQAIGRSPSYVSMYARGYIHCLQKKDRVAFAAYVGCDLSNLDQLKWTAPSPALQECSDDEALRSLLDRFFRQNPDISAAEASRAMGYNQGYLHNFMHGKVYRLKPESRSALEAYLGFKLSELAGFVKQDRVGRMRSSEERKALRGSKRENLDVLPIPPVMETAQAISEQDKANWTFDSLAERFVDPMLTDAKRNLYTNVYCGVEINSLLKKDTRLTSHFVKNRYYGIRVVHDDLVQSGMNRLMVSVVQPSHLVPVIARHIVLSQDTTLTEEGRSTHAALRDAWLEFSRTHRLLDSETVRHALPVAVQHFAESRQPTVASTPLNKPEDRGASQDIAASASPGSAEAVPRLPPTSHTSLPDSIRAIIEKGPTDSVVGQALQKALARSSEGVGRG